MKPSPLLLPAILAVFLTSAKADLVAHYALDETDPTSTTIIDSLGNNHGTVISLPNVTKNIPAPHGTAYDFGLRGGAIINPNPAVQPTDQFTISWWFRPTTLNDFDRLYETLSGTGDNGNGIRIDLGSAPGNKIRALIRDGNGSTNTTVSHPLVLTTNTWYFFALRYDSIAGNCQVTVLQDTGSAIDASSITTATSSNNSLGTNLITHATGVFIAADDAAASTTNDFGGAMDDIAFFQTGDNFGVLTDDELAQVYNVGALAFDPTTPTPSISSFTADNPSVTSGSNVTLNWEVTNADTVTITPDIGNVANPSGSTHLIATQTKIYTITATNSSGTASQSLQITVDGLALTPLINEFAASNNNFDDGDGNQPDWIEIHNPNATPFDISSYFLTDNASLPTKWSFPAGTILAPNQYLIVFASAQPTNNYTDATGNLHTNFSLNANGEYLALIAPNGLNILQEFAPQYPPQNTNTSYTSTGYLATPTPRAPNIGTPQQGIVTDTSFDFDRGFYSTPFNVTITTSTTGAEIYYTTDGSIPTTTNGTLYTSPVNISTTTILRAAAFKDNFIPTNTDTQSYIFLADILTQSNSPPNTTTSWAGHPADYEMDPDIVNHPSYASELIPALTTFPTLSIAIKPDDFYGTQGLYQNPLSQGPAWERPVSAELIVHDDSEPGFQIEAGLRIQGGSSRNPDTPKHSMSLRFRNDYGSGKLNYPLFKDAPFGHTSTEKFDTLQLRSGYNFGWTHRHYYQSQAAQYNRDQFANDLMLSLGSPGSHGRWVHLYLNGIYWGIYHLHERPDNNFMATYFGGNGDDYDAINSNVATSGNTTAYTNLKNHGAAGLSDPANYEIMKTHLDIDSFIDYMLVNFYTGNRDWDGHNWRAAGQGPSGIPFHYFTWDTEFAISPWAGGVFTNPAPISDSLNTNVTTKNNNNGPTGVHQDLRSNAEYRLRFADRAHAAMFNDGPMTPTGATAIWRTRSNQMDTAIIAESARWGDFRRDVEAGSQWSSSQYDLYTRDEHYLPAQDWIINTYLQQRTAIVLAQLRSQNLYPTIDAPVYSQSGNTLTMINPNPTGTILYTTDGSDPRDPGALTYTSPINLNLSATYNSRVLNGSVWSALQSSEILTGIPANSSNLTISELFYNPPGSLETDEFIELTNISSNTIDLSNLNFTAGLTYTIPLGTTLSPGAQLILTPTQFTGNLDNNGETITLNDATGAIIESFTYNDNLPWPTAPDGDGFSLVRIALHSQLDPNLPSSWRPSTTTGGNPGTTDNTTFTGGDSAALLTYALGNNPLIPSVNPPTLTFSQNIAADDLLYLVETSPDLTTWTTISDLTSQSSPISGFSLTTFNAPPSSPPADRLFFRIRVELR